jgi:hypothetical protein
MWNAHARAGNWALGFLAVGGLAFGAVLIAGFTADEGAAWKDSRALVSELGLTDLCLFTEARYTRHLAMADWHTPFQDHPMALEHFPSGALLAPPPHLGSHAPVVR